MVNEQSVPIQTSPGPPNAQIDVSQLGSGNVRQNVTIADPSNAAGVAPVDASLGLSVNVTQMPAITLQTGVTPVLAASISGLTVNGTLTVTQGTSPWVTSGGSSGGITPVQAATLLGLTVTGTVLATQNGSWTVQQGNPPWVVNVVSSVPNLTITSMPAVTAVISGTPTVNVVSTVPNLTLTSLPTLTINNPTVNQGTSPWSTSVVNNPDVQISGGTLTGISNTVTISGNVGVTGTPNVNVVNNPDVQVSGGTLTGISNSVTILQGTSPWVTLGGVTPVIAATSNGLTVSGAGTVGAPNNAVMTVQGMSNMVPLAVSAIATAVTNQSNIYTPGQNAQLAVDLSGSLHVVGDGTVGSPDPGVITVQGATNMFPVVTSGAVSSSQGTPAFPSIVNAWPVEKIFPTADDAVMLGDQGVIQQREQATGASPHPELELLTLDTNMLNAFGTQPLTNAGRIKVENAMIPEQIVQGAMSALNQEVKINLSGMGTLTLQTQGVWAGTLSFFGSVDGQNWNAINGLALNAIIFTVSSTLGGIFRFPVSGLTAFKVQFTAYTSGAARVVIVATPVVTTPTVVAITSTSAQSVTAQGSVAGPVNQNADGRLVVQDSGFAKDSLLYPDAFNPLTTYNPGDTMTWGNGQVYVCVAVLAGGTAASTYSTNGVPLAAFFVIDKRQNKSVVANQYAYGPGSARLKVETELTQYTREVSEKQMMRQELGQFADIASREATLLAMDDTGFNYNKGYGLEQDGSAHYLYEEIM